MTTPCTNVKGRHLIQRCTRRMAPGLSCPTSSSPARRSASSPMRRRSRRARRSFPGASSMRTRRSRSRMPVSPAAPWKTEGKGDWPRGSVGGVVRVTGGILRDRARGWRFLPREACAPAGHLPRRFPADRYTRRQGLSGHVIELTAGLAISGRVVDDATSEPVAGAEVVPFIMEHR